MEGIMNLNFNCPRCGSQKIGKHGFYKCKSGWRRRWRCKECEKTFSRSTLSDQELEESNEEYEKTADELLNREDKRAIHRRARKEIKKLFPEQTDQKYSAEQIIDVLLHIALHNQFLAGGTEQYQEKNNNEQTPSENTIYGRLKQLDPQSTLQGLDLITRTLCEQLKQKGFFNKPVDVAIDEHDWLFYGDGTNEEVVRTKPKEGTNKAYKFMTLCVVTNNIRMTIGVVPMTDTGVVAFRDGVQELVKKAQKRCRIRVLYADRGFYKAPVIELLEQREVNYFVRAYMGKTIKNMYRENDDEVHVDTYTVKRKAGPPYVQVDTRVVIGDSQKEEDQLVAFVTNLGLGEQKGNEFIEQYMDRWGIETSYRMIGQFLAKTTSRKYQIRIGLFVLAVVLYNLWVYENAHLAGRGWIKVSVYSTIITEGNKHTSNKSLLFVLLLSLRKQE